MLRVYACITGLFFIIIAVLGFMPEFNQGGRFLGIFAISSLSNIIHLATGIAGLMCALKTEKSSLIFFIVVGLFYGIMAALGFYNDSLALFRFIAVDNGNNILHALMAFLALYLCISYLRRSPKYIPKE